MIPICHAPGCDAPATRCWQRAATAAELASLPELAAAEGQAAAVKLGCDEHAVPIEAAAALHEADCQAPPECTCTPAHPPADPLPF
ncbi:MULTISPECIES: hypothetical protein [unclassified Crossiella]|uniref:hypothetical protein n=1 Tax=unclassified Crossiella TaxID=2620835 RepID=UPI001FFE4EDD|nr:MULTISPECIES: hypothetical protein [unclassified Crossiella]MCK2242157.1 hypothetical protein [Crossiella sp. S99.2]MCK2256060.1 hypothetical protein [Crossiella sp. S99.1]